MLLADSKQNSQHVREQTVWIFSFFMTFCSLCKNSSSSRCKLRIPLVSKRFFVTKKWQDGCVWLPVCRALCLRFKRSAYLKVAWEHSYSIPNLVVGNNKYNTRLFSTTSFPLPCVAYFVAKTRGLIHNSIFFHGRTTWWVCLPTMLGALLLLTAL